MKRADRLKLIEEIIAGGNITSQEQLLRSLEDRGIKCTQATLSRDIRQIGAGRFSDGGDYPRYMILRKGSSTKRREEEIFNRAIISLQWARDLLIVKTSPGFAAGVASRIDNGNCKTVAGTVAGDDTIIVVPADQSGKDSVLEEIGLLFHGFRSRLKV